jgi:SAM-dependent methyltransferase
MFLLHLGEALRHVAALERHLDRPLGELALYEFGAGWDLIGPLTFWSVGVDRQVLVDLEAHVRPELVRHSLGQLERHQGELELRVGRPVRRPPSDAIETLDELRPRFGIEYHAPRDARSTGFEAETFDAVTSTFTLEHIPRHDILAILREIRRLLRPGGVVSFSVDMYDHYSFDDPRISAYNFLRYSDRTWRLVNSSLHHQNRLRARDYLELLAEAGFGVLEAATDDPTDDQRAQLESLPLAPRFREGYSLDELAPLTLRVVASPKASTTA